ncbi:hypothetical protein ACIP5Y_21275 [Nocardia sp. NPDC088792]|uniref:hypothetical protein n=1 Tax=Nocardia sp. NPDC088792 TaxID=3364332 RepID=UPI003804E4A2
MSDDLLEEAERHLAHDRDRDEKLDRAQRFAEALRSADNPDVREAGIELAGIVGVPQ